VSRSFFAYSLNSEGVSVTAVVGMDAASAVLWLRRGGQADVERHPLSRVTVGIFAESVPWRTFRWYEGQRHYSGQYWSSTERAHVIYESRLELARLLFADFDVSVHRILAQPFLLTLEIDGSVRRHVPDFLLLTRTGPLVVDVKPRDRLAKPKVDFTLAWTRSVMASCGWDYEVFSEPPQVLLDNVRFLAGFRRDWLFDGDLLTQLRGAGLDGLTLGEALQSLAGWPHPIVKAAVLHLIWSGFLATGLESPLSAGSVLRVVAR
jgi:hypothetical protein